MYDAVVVGAGPNGLSAAVELARNGLGVVILESEPEAGGGCRTTELTGPGYRHDVCSAIHPMGALSPFFRSLGLERHGLEWVRPDVALAHPFDDGTAATLHRSLGETVLGLGDDARAYRRLVEPFTGRADDLFDALLRPIRPHHHPLLLARFGLRATRSADHVARKRFAGRDARALFAGCAAHSFLPLDFAGTAAFGLTLMVAAHAVDWPIARGGSGRIIDALVACLKEQGGEVRTGERVGSLDDIPASRAVIFDLVPRQLAAIAGDALPRRYRRRLERFRYGPGAFKVDWALDGPIPWAAEACRRAGTVHLGGPYEEVAAGEAEAWRGGHPDRPFVLVAQQSLFDDTRAPASRHTGWAYCHVPNGSDVDMTDAIERQVERFAPGFRDRILARHTRTARDLEAYNPAMIGGDVGGGANTLWQFLARPAPRLDPYATPNPRLFIGSASTPPGGGVHGMCGHNAARSVLRRVFGRGQASSRSLSGSPVTGKTRPSSSSMSR